MRAVQLSGLREVREVEIEEPVPGPGDVLITIDAVGICGSDLHAYHGTHPFRRPPLILGHEPAGRVTAFGPGTGDGLDLGERVLVQPLRTCGGCGRCQAGRSNLCPDKEFPATPGWTGALAESFVVPAAKVYPLGVDLPGPTAALAEPLAVAIHALRNAGALGVRRLAVLGAGSIGLLTLVAARALGIARVAITDVVERKLVLARDLGGLPVDAREAVPGAVREALSGPADAVLVTGSYPDALADAVAVAAPGAPVVLVALSGTTLALPADELVLHERAVRGTVLYTDRDFELAARLLATEGPSLGRLVTHILPFAEAARAFDLLDSGREDPVKIVLTPLRD